MKLLQELLSLREEAIEVKPAADVWQDGKDSVKSYIATAVYQVRQIEDSDPVKWEVYTDKDGSRKLVGKFDTADLEEMYVPVRPNQKEDAEGYTMYRDNTEVEAFKYDGDTIKVDLDGKTKKLVNGDYLIRETDDDNFVYSVQSAKYFETDYSEKK